MLPLTVANRAGETANSTIDPAAFEKNLEAKIDMRVPEDVKTAKQAANLGKALLTVAPKAEVSRQILGLAHVITGIPQEKKTEEASGGLLKNIMGAAGKLRKEKADAKDAKHEPKTEPKPA